MTSAKKKNSEALTSTHLCLCCYGRGARSHIPLRTQLEQKKKNKKQTNNENNKRHHSQVKEKKLLNRGETELDIQSTRKEWIKVIDMEKTKNCVPKFQNGTTSALESAKET